MSGRAIAESGRKLWDGPKPISIVGSTGSIGTQVKTFKPQLVAVRNESLIGELKEALADAEHKLEIILGEEGVIEVARHQDAVTIVIGIVGCAGSKVLSMLLDRSVHSDLLNRHKQAPLMLAAMHGACVKKLLQAGTNILMFDSLHCACTTLPTAAMQIACKRSSWLPTPHLLLILGDLLDL